MGKLIVIEGLDGCGKSTQLEMLCNRLKSENIAFREVSFPNYSSPACEPVKMYLSGQFGTDVNDVSGYAASVLYAVDRYASFKTDWGEAYNRGEVIACGRYVTSNLVHQCSKLDREDWPQFSKWLYDFEYGKMALPQPDLIIFLSMPTEYSDRLLDSRYDGDTAKRDIHELDREYQIKCREAALFAAENGNWKTVNCVENGQLRNREDIAEEIYGIVQKIL